MDIQLSDEHLILKCRFQKRNKRVIANANVISEIDTALTSPLYSATAYLAHLLLRETQPNAYAKAKEPNAIARFDFIDSLMEVIKVNGNFINPSTDNIRIINLKSYF